MGSSENDKPIVVAGGSGFLGQSVIDYLTAQGRRCVIVDKKEPTMPVVKQALEEGKASLVIVDLLHCAEIDLITPKLPPAFHLVNLATVIEVTTQVTLEAKRSLEFHCGIAMNMADRWRDRIISICHASSWEVYGVPKRLPLDENHETEPFNVYGVGKLMTENYLRVFCRERGIPLTILRLSHLYGPGEWHHKAIPNFIKNCLAGRPHKLFGGGKDLRELVNNRDVARAILLSLERNVVERPGAVFNIAGGRCLNIRQILEVIQKVMGTDLPVEGLPADRPPIDLSFDLIRAKEQLGWEPRVAFEDGVREEAEWFRSEATI